MAPSISQVMIGVWSVGFSSEIGIIGRFRARCPGRTTRADRGRSSSPASPQSASAYSCVRSQCRLSFPEAVLRGDGSAPLKDARIVFATTSVDARELVGIVRDEVLVRMPLPAWPYVTACATPCVVGERARVAIISAEPPIRHGPIRGHLPPAVRPTRRAALVHRRRHGVTKLAARRAARPLGVDIHVARVDAERSASASHCRAAGPPAASCAGGLLEVHHRRRRAPIHCGPRPSRAIVEREAIEEL